ncbi:MAG: ABC transporter permease subunit [Clostridiaceae bacterium]|nr:ABC transporter permease subunit [Clostridiaceae bacterium]
MNKIINKALFYKEWINVRWVTLLTIVILLYYKVYAVIAELNGDKSYMAMEDIVRTDRWFYNGFYSSVFYFLVMAFAIIILAIILFIGEKTSETQGFIASMPFTRKEIILNKWMVGVLSIIISFVVTFIFLSLVYVAKINNLNTTLNPYSELFKWFFMDTFQYICIFTFMVLVQSIMGNSIVSGIVGGAILLLPWFINETIKVLFIFISDKSAKVFDQVGGWLNIYGYNSTQHGMFEMVNTSTSRMSSNQYYNDYKDYGLKLLILLILTCLFLCLAYVSFKKRNIEYNLRLVAFKNLELVFIWVFAVYTGILGGETFGLGISGKGLSVFCICTVIFSIAGYFISKGLLKILSSSK